MRLGGSGRADLGRAQAARPRCHGTATPGYATRSSAGTNVLRDILRGLGVLGVGAQDKFLPDNYRFGARAVRQQVLAGLLDTDGHYTHGCFEIASASQRLAEDIAFVARSLGLRALVAKKTVSGTMYWRLCISGDSTGLPLRVVRKIPQPRRQKKDVLRTGFTLHDAGEGTYFGFTVDGDHRYLLGDFTVTHNSGKTIMLSAAVGEHIHGSGAKAAEQVSDADTSDVAAVKQARQTLSALVATRDAAREAMAVA